ncbi:myosin binding protein Hb isoform X1 [Neoarius graeffei]|uniref:myosin binding protein Hb isoform X1 n=1 Tax=Neoarius graeffei TaxID=443677 RepID=UPI00298C98F1|nr:myosin binding protein Hb isoform X1 [Neoarius graeffei]
MPAKPAPIKKGAKVVKKEAPPPKSKPKPAPEAPPVEAPPVEAPPPAAAPAAAPPAEAPPAEAAPAEAPPAEVPKDAPAAEAPPAEAIKAPTPPPSVEPPSEPLELTVEDVSDVSVTIQWRPPANIGNAGLNGYTVECCKEGTGDWKAVNDELSISCRYVIKNQTTGDRLNIRVVAVNAGGRSPPATFPDAVLVREVVARPKIRPPRSLRQRYVVNVGEKVNLVIPFTGKPQPVITWTKDGQPIDTKRVNVRNSDRDSIFFIRSSERADSGVYEMCIKVDSFEDKAQWTLQIIELPGPPTGIKIVDTWGFNVALEWTEPKDNGNTTITGYTVQKADKKTGDWFTVLEHYHRLNATVSDLIMGNTYTFRVFAENKCGISKDATVTKTSATIQKTGINYKPPDYKERDFTEAPKFTTDMPDRCTTVGYSTKLLCSVRGFPKPKIQWMKNQMIIGDDPKYRQLNNQGICSLEIRKPGNFDGGVYTCRAINEHGEAAVTCKLEVKQPVILDADKK